MEQGEYLFSGNTWFKERLHGDDAYYWKKARKLFLFRLNLSSALNLFKFDYRTLQTQHGDEGSIVIISRNRTPDPDEDNRYRPGRVWLDDAKNSIRTLVDLIVTRWMPNYLRENRIGMGTLHNTLTPVPLQHVRTTYDDTDDDVESYDVDEAFTLYGECFVPLHYHELWSEIAADCKDVETTLRDRETVIFTGAIEPLTTRDQSADTALIFGTNKVVFVDNYRPLSRKLGLFDLVFVTVNNFNYFGMIVHVQEEKVEVKREDERAQISTTGELNHNNLQFDIFMTVGIYTSRLCSDAVQQHRHQTNDKNLTVTKLSNITSTRRMISAVHNLGDWPQFRSLLKPTIDDPYFQLPEGYDPFNVPCTYEFNSAQSKAISLAECMFDDQQERMHLIHGPPGTGKSRTIAGIVIKLLGKMLGSGRKQKILLCAPSNNACDELCRRLLDELTNQNLPLKRGTLVRIGCQPPDDRQLCDHFLDFMVLQDIVDVLKAREQYTSNIAIETENRLMKHAKIVVSTLNYCGSTRMQKLKSNTEFIIVDEACQSLEADLLLPLRFRCTKLLLVGDPQQLPPCVLSHPGKIYGLSQSLYGRLYSLFQAQGDGPISMLDTQYRMHPVICQFPSDHFYDGRLQTDPSVERRMKHYPLKPLHVFNMLGSPHKYDNALSSFNESETKCIGRFCHLLIAFFVHHSEADVSDDTDSDEDDDDSSSTTSYADSFHSSDQESIRGRENVRQHYPSVLPTDPRSIKFQKRIAVITPYKAQLRLLRQCLPNYIEITTVDGSQGKEKDIVILSCVRSGTNIGFLSDMNRANVMLTRSKYGLYVFGNITQLAAEHESWKAFETHVHRHRLISNVQQLEPELPFRFL